MAENVTKEIECFKKDFDKIYAKGTWTKDDIEMMKDLKKLMYYCLVIDSMENGGSYPGSEYMPGNSGSMRQSYGRGYGNMGYGNQNSGMNSGRGYGDQGSGMYYPEYPQMNGNRYYDGMSSSGRRYYDSEKEKAVHKLHHMMENTDDPERKNALKIAINELEQK